jgi:uncharacterized membrane protein YjfL (UPF0719 family)
VTTPRYAQWRAEADRAAQNDPAVAQKLAELDSLMAQSKAQPAVPRPLPSDSGESGFLLIVVILGGAVLVALWALRRRATTATGGGTMAATRSLSGSSMTAGMSSSAASRFRVGMTFPIDPSAFVLAHGVTKVKPPEAGGMISVEGVGLITDGRVLLHRLYLPGREAFFMIHLGSDGAPDESRYFSLLDQITPANRDEWGFWLDPAQGMIGWPQFQTKDGKTYDRVWAPGNARVTPRQQVETVQDVSGATERKIQAMLYGARTGAPPPAPALDHGLPMLIIQVVACAVLLAIGVTIYIRLTPFREREMIEDNNPAAGTMLAGAILALAIPLAAMLATSVTLIDILVWGVVALILQLLTLGIVMLAMRNFRGMIERGNIAAAITLAGAQIAIALLNAAAMVPQ